jgi:murein L,D-transpeptidase YafK
MRKLLLMPSLFLLAACVTGGPQTSKIVVAKSDNMMYLVNNEGVSYKSYKIAMGGNPRGHKQKEGDEKTPEGTYFIEGRNPNSKFHRSLKISYPDPLDKRQAKQKGVSPGGDIFIHGLPNDTWLLNAYKYQNNPQWTDGCIAVANSDIEEMWRLVPDGTPIDIYP